MANKSVLVVNKIAAEDLGSLNRSAVINAEVVNGSIYQLASGYSATAGEGEVFTATLPATSALSNLWMTNEALVNQAEINGKIVRGITIDPRDFSIPANKAFSVFKPQVGDIITITADGLAGTKSTNTFVVAANASALLTWAASAASGLSFKLLETTYLSIGSGAIDTQRVTAYRFECVAIA